MSFRSLGGARIAAVALLAVALAACSDDGAGGKRRGSTFHVGGTLTGLVDGTSVMLANDGGSLTLSENGAFAFTREFGTGDSYAVSVATHPEGQTCAVGNGTGTVAEADVTDVAVTCTPESFDLGGTVTGLPLGFSITVLGSGGAPVTVAGPGGAFSVGPVAFGTAYEITVDAEYPVACTVENGSGVMGAAPVTNVLVACTATGFSVGGTVSGLAEDASLELKNGAELLTVQGSGPFVFEQQVLDLGSYDVTIPTQPDRYTCTVENGSGTLAGGPVDDVVVNCVRSWNLNVNVTGLVAGTKLVVGGPGEPPTMLEIRADGSYVLGEPLFEGESFSVEIAAQPVGQSCEILSGASGQAGETETIAVQVFCMSNVMVLRVGDGVAELGNDAAPVLVEEIRPATGEVVRSIPIPSTGPDRLTNGSMLTFNEGKLSRSIDGRFVTFAGYDADAGTTWPGSTLSAETNRLVGRIDARGEFTIPVRLTDAYSEGSIRAAKTVDGTGYWISGDDSWATEMAGVRYALPNATPGTSAPVSSASEAIDIEMAGDRIYFSYPGYMDSGLALLEGPLPTSLANSTTIVQGVRLPLAFAMLDLDPAIPGEDTAYVANGMPAWGAVGNSVTVQKWLFNGTEWTRVEDFLPMFPEDPSITRPRIPTDLVAVETPAGVRVFFTNDTVTLPSDSINTLATFLDDGENPRPTVTVVATAPAATAYRGVALAPLPEIPIDCSGAAPNTICVPSDSEALLFSAVATYDDATIQLHRTTPDGEVAVQLTPYGPRQPTDSHNEAVRSPDRKTLVIVSGRDWEEDTGAGDPTRGVLYVVNADGTGLRKLTNSPAMECREWGPRFSHSGEWVVFVRSCRHDELELENVEMLWRIRLDGTGEQRLIDPEDLETSTFGAFSPDDQTVYSVAMRSGSGVLVAWDSTTGQSHDVLDLSSERLMISRWPNVLPNGDLLLNIVDLYTSREPTLELIHPDGTGRTVLRTLEQTELYQRIDRDFAISPDGTRLAYLHLTLSPDGGTSTDTVMVSDLDGSNAVAVSQPFAFVRWVTWNP